MAQQLESSSPSTCKEFFCTNPWHFLDVLAPAWVLYDWIVVILLSYLVNLTGSAAFSWHYFRKFQLTCGWFAGFWGLLGEGRGGGCFRKLTIVAQCGSIAAAIFWGESCLAAPSLPKMTNSKWQLTSSSRCSIEIVQWKWCKGSATKKLSAVRGNNQQKASWTGDAGQQKWLNGSSVAAALAKQQAVTWIGF